jgi:hypothetical protein
MHSLKRCGKPTGKAGAAKACSGVRKMTRARGQISRTLLNREYPHQVLVRADNVAGKTLDKVADFHVKLGIGTKSRSIRKDDVWYSLYCFADREHAKLFQVLFGGEITQAQSKD